MDRLSYAILDVAALSAACLPFIKGGGLFIKTQSLYTLGESVAIELELLEEPELLRFAATVVWLTPKHERDQLPQGIGLQFSDEDAKRMREKIESYLPDAFTPGQYMDFFG